MIDNRQQVQSVPLLNRPDFLGILQPLFEDAWVPPSEAELRSVEVISDSSRVWLPDIEWELYNAFLDNPDRESADDQYWQDLQQKAKFRPELPHRFVRRPQQIDFDLFPYWNIQDCYNFALDTHPEFIASGIDVGEFVKFVQPQRVAAIAAWLSRLPLQRDEKVFFAHHTDYTLMADWGTFIQHWDAFHAFNGMVPMNVVDDNPEWYVLFLYDNVVAFGCTEDYRRSKGGSIPLSVGDAARFRAVSSRVSEVDRWETFKAMITTYKAVTKQ